MDCWHFFLVSLPFCTLSQLLPCISFRRLVPCSWHVLFLTSFYRGDQHLLRRSLHVGDVAENVQHWISGRDHFHYLLFGLAFPRSRLSAALIRVLLRRLISVALAPARVTLVWIDRLPSGSIPHSLTPTYPPFPSVFHHHHHHQTEMTCPVINTSSHSTGSVMRRMLTGVVLGRFDRGTRAPTAPKRWLSMYAIFLLSGVGY